MAERFSSLNALRALIDARLAERDIREHCLGC